MKCLRCASTMRTRRENYKYDACGLPGITLVGVGVARCPKCGDHEVAIPRIEDLHRAIAQAVIRKKGRLTPEEVRFLRKYLGWSGSDFSSHIGVTPETVSRWEQGAARVGATADRLLRLMVVTREPASDYSLDILKEIPGDEPAPLTLGLRVGRKGWRVAA